MEDFATSRGEDDLFDDDFTPVEASQAEFVTVQNIASIPAPVQPPKGLSNSFKDQNERGRGRGRAARGRASGSGLMSSRFAPQPQNPQPHHRTSPPKPQQEHKTEPTPSAAPATKGQSTQADSVTQSRTEDDDVSAQEPAATQAPQTPARPPAVKGDRTATGGVKKAKLTEEELTAKLAAAKERSQNLSAAHARAQADAAAHEERERVAQQKRAKDAVNRKAMDSERERNRARKLQAVGGREWDAEKTENDFKTSGPGRGGGPHPRQDPAMDDLSQYQWHEDRGRGRGQGRSRGGNRGRGDARNGDSRLPPAKDEFPSLPPKQKPADGVKPGDDLAPKKTNHTLSPGAEGGTWADQVESSEAAKQGVGQAVDGDWKKEADGRGLKW